MEGPTPVSALLHAATMVTAGVYLLLRISPVLNYFPTCLTLCATVGALTALISAVAGCLQNDIKKIIAYSTCSQLGYMFMAIGTTNFIGALYHLVNHAFFKALLFLGAGVLIHLFNNQDIRRFSALNSKGEQLRYNYKLFSLLILIGNMSLVGVPFTSGAYSKDYILEYAEISGYHFCRFIGLLTIALTTFYSVRLVYKSFYSLPARFSRHLVTNAQIRLSWVVWGPLVTLGLLSIFSGYVFKEVFMGLGSDVFIDSMPLSRNRFEHDLEYLSVLTKQTPAIIVFVVGIGTIFCYKYPPLKNTKILTFYIDTIWLQKQILVFLVKEHCGFNRVYYSLVHPIMQQIHKILFKELERGVLEDISYYWIIRVVQRGMLKVKQSQPGSILVNIFLVVSTVFFITFMLVYVDVG
jgi:NADH-ubiquinone oxidoreductase chain 5